MWDTRLYIFQGLAWAVSYGSHVLEAKTPGHFPLSITVVINDVLKSSNLEISSHWTSKEALVLCTFSCLALPPLLDESFSLYLMRLFTLTVWYRHRNARRQRKCSKANEVLSLQRILPGERKRKMKVHVRQQLLRITGSWLIERVQSWKQKKTHAVTIGHLQFICLNDLRVFYNTKNP